ncbi:hypothetical protein DFH09DRAFT_1313925 [Mycena vulgaris]|nr:hypothetical protein DFH09DRAFT_1313925 [Mycena vulgaris]
MLVCVHQNAFSFLDNPPLAVYRWPRSLRLPPFVRDVPSIDVAAAARPARGPFSASFPILRPSHPEAACQRARPPYVAPVPVGFLQLPLVHPHPRLVRTCSATSCARTAAYPEPRRGAYNPPRSSPVMKLYRSATPFNQSEDAETRIPQAAILFFKNICAEPSDDNPETVDIYTILRDAVGGSQKCEVVLEEFAAEWPEACKADAKKWKLPQSLAAKQEQRAKVTQEGYGVVIYIREKLWTLDAQHVYYLKYNSGMDLNCILWRINSWWIRDCSGPVIIRNPYFYTMPQISKNSRMEEFLVEPLPLHQIVKSKDQFVMYIDKLSCVWLADTKQRFGNICRLGKRGSYLVKDAHGVLHNSVDLGRPFEDRELYVVRREGGQDEPPVRNTWKQLLDEWDATDSETKFIVTIHRQQYTSFTPRLNVSASTYYSNCHTPAAYHTFRLGVWCWRDLPSND